MTSPTSEPAQRYQVPKSEPKQRHQLPETKGKRHIMLFVGVAVLIVALLWGGKKYIYARSHISTDDASVDGHIVPVVAKVGGYVASVSVSENEHVTPGQVVVQL